MQSWGASQDLTSSAEPVQTVLLWDFSRLDTTGLSGKIFPMIWCLKLYRSIETIYIYTEYMSLCEVGIIPWSPSEGPSNMPMLTLARRARTAQAPRESHSTHVVPALKQTESAFKDKDWTWIHWTLSQVLWFSLFINLSVSLNTEAHSKQGLRMGWAFVSSKHQHCLF